MSLLAVKVVALLVLFDVAFSQQICGDGGDTLPCVCALLDNSGTIDLSSIGTAKNDSWFYDIPSATYLFFYSYNPCYKFTDCYGISGLALSETPGDLPEPCLDVGTMNSSRFVSTEDNGVALHYHSYDLTRTAIVYLECNSTAKTNEFIPYGNDYDRINFTFKLRGPASCVIPYPGRTRLSSFIIVIIVVVTGLLCYLVCAVLYKRWRNRKTTSSGAQSSKREALKSIFWPQSNRSDILDDTNAILGSSTVNYGSTDDEASSLP